jgi:hypothetical protein
MQIDWADWLPITEFTYNNYEHSATGFSHIFLKYGHHQFIPMAPQKPQINNPTADEFADSLSQV